MRFVTAGSNNKPTVMRSITVGPYFKPAMMNHWDNSKVRGEIFQSHLIIYKIEPKNLGRLGLEHRSWGLNCGVLTVEPVGEIRKKGKRYPT